MLNPCVSIITCVFNGEKYIERLLQCILNSKYQNVEHIIIDDGSSDNTKKIVFEYSKRYEKNGKRIIYHYQTNKGLGYSTNIGLSLITGSYWTWINCDDWYCDDFVYYLANYLEKHKKIDVVIPNGYWVPENSNIKQTFYVRGSIPFMHWFLNNNSNTVKNLCFNNKRYRQGLYMVRTSSYKKINPTMSIHPSRYTQDLQLMVQLLFFLKCSFVNKKLFSLLTRSNSLYRSFDICADRQNDIAVKLSFFKLNYSKRRDEVFFNYCILSKIIRNMWYFYKIKDNENLISLYKKYIALKKWASSKCLRYRHYFYIKTHLKLLLIHIYLLHRRKK